MLILDPNIVTVGASGAVFGLMGAGVVYGLQHRRSLPPPLARLLGRGLAPWVLLNLAIGVVLPFIDNLGHLGGLLGGSLTAALLGDRLRPWSTRWAWAAPAMGLVSLGLLSWMLRGLLGA